VKLAETGDLPGALDLFSKAIEVAPSRASGYNNRAQTLRLMGKIDGNAKLKLHRIHNYNRMLYMKKKSY